MILWIESFYFDLSSVISNSSISCYSISRLSITWCYRMELQLARLRDDYFTPNLRHCLQPVDFETR